MNPRLAILFGTLISVPCEAAEPTAEQADFFETRIRPVLVEHCHRCHSEDAERLKAGLKLDSLAGLLRGGDLGPALDLDKPEASLLLEAIGWKTRDLQMPPKAPLPERVRMDFKKWVEMGAPWLGSPASRRSGGRERYDFAAARKHWAFQSVCKPDVPAKAKGSEIDWFVRRKLTNHKLSVLTKRRSIPDPTRLPDDDRVATNTRRICRVRRGAGLWYEVVERLLASPHYGALWGRHWLDVARFADGYGGFLDGGKFDQAWRYRDWVMTALNEDMPYDRFLKLQLAGDLLEPEEHALATGFLALGPQYRGDGGDALSNAIAKSETLDDRVDTVGRGILGLTMACARCHDHKFDPIPTIDYYSIAGIFQNTRVGDYPLVPQQEIDDWNAAIKAIGDYRKETDERLRKLGDELVDRELDRLPEYALAALAYAKLEPNLRSYATGPVSRGWLVPFSSTPNPSSRGRRIARNLHKPILGFGNGPPNP